MILDILAIIAPVFVIAALGYGWARAKMPFDTRMVSALVLHIGAPCLLLSQLLARPVDLGALSQIVVATVAVMVLTGLVAAIGLRVFGLSIRSFLPPLIFPNTGNMGLPLCLFAFGETGLAFAIAYFAATALLQFSFGVAVSSGRFDWRTFAANPVLWSMVLAIGLTVYDLALPVWVMNTLTTLGGVAIPLMLMSLGTSLATLAVSSVGRAIAFSAFRLGGGFIAALIVVAALGLEGPARGAVIIQSAMPTAVFNYLFALQYDNQPGEVAGMVLVSTLLSFAMLPLLLAYVLGG